MLKYGFAGLRLKLEQQQTEQKISAVTLGVNSLVHAIKNNALLSKYEIKNLIEEIEGNKDISKSIVNDNLLSIMEKTDYLIELVNQISKNINNKQIVKVDCMLFDVIDESLDLISPMVEKDKYVIEKEIPKTLTTYQAYHLVYGKFKGKFKDN